MFDPGCWIFDNRSDHSVYPASSILYPEAASLERWLFQQPHLLQDLGQLLLLLGAHRAQMNQPPAADPRLEVVSQPRITPEGKAQTDLKAQSACGG
jgi:hypothetical protein